MARKRFDVVDFKRQVRQIGSYLDGSAGIILSDLDKFLALWRLEENQLRATSAGDASDLFEPKHMLVKVNGLLEVSDAVTRVIQFLNHTHESNCESQRCLNAKPSSPQERPLAWHPDAELSIRLRNDWPGFDFEVLRCQHMVRSALRSGESVCRRGIETPFFD